MKLKFLKIFFFILILILWESAFHLIGWKPWVFPAPSGVLQALLILLKGPEGIFSSPLVIAQTVSSFRLLLGFILSGLAGALAGIVMWRIKIINQILGPFFLGIQTLPSVCWIPMAVLSFGINEFAIQFVLFMGSFCSVAISLRDGLKNIPPFYTNAGKMLGARRLTLYRFVLLPASLPALSNSLRQGFTFCWRSLMGAELIFMVEKKGLGFLLAMGRDFSDIAQVIAVMGVMILTGMLIDLYIFAKIDNLVRTRFGLIGIRD